MNVWQTQKAKWPKPSIFYNRRKKTVHKKPLQDLYFYVYCFNSEARTFELVHRGAAPNEKKEQSEIRKIKNPGVIYRNGFGKLTWQIRNLENECVIMFI